jgi:hypothetical protein
MDMDETVKLEDGDDDLINLESELRINEHGRIYVPPS